MTGIIHATPDLRVRTLMDEHMGLDVAGRPTAGGDHQVYGPQFHLLPLAKAVSHRMLSDYRVILLGVGRASVTPGLRRRLEDLSPSTSRKNAPTANDMTRVLGVSLAVNGGLR